MKIIADTGPLIGLAKLGRLMLLSHPSSEVLIPPAVQRELLGKPGAEAAEIDSALTGLLRVEEPDPLEPSREAWWMIWIRARSRPFCWLPVMRMTCCS